MRTQTHNRWLRYFWLALMLAAWPMAGNAQVAVAEIEEVEELPTVPAEELEELVGPIALYPDDLLAIVLPASTFPLQIVEAARFLEDLQDDSTLEPDPDWDDSVVALLNYPEVVALLNEDLDWTWRLGEAVVAQQADVISAIEMFRDRAYAAGNLQSDEHQVVAHEGGSIQITPAEEDVIYVPYYEPERVVVYQPRPVYYYYPRPYPVYYYPYPTYHVFYDNYFWGVTTAFSIAWHSHHLNVFHHSFFGHPYYGHHYWNRWWYRRPDIHVYNNVYVRNHGGTYHDRYRHGDRWFPNVRRTVRSSDQRVTRTRYYPNANPTATTETNRNISTFARTDDRRQTTRPGSSRRDAERLVRTETRRPEIRFRERSGTPSISGSNRTPTRNNGLTDSRRDRNTVTTPATTTRPSLQVRQRESRDAQPNRSERRTAPSRRTEPRESQLRPSQPRHPQARATQSRERSQPKATHTRSSPPQVTTASRSSSKGAHSNRSRSKASDHNRSRPRQSKSVSSQSQKSERVSRSSSSRNSRSSRHID